MISRLHLAELIRDWTRLGLEDLLWQSASIRLGAAAGGNSMISWPLGEPRLRN
jgi:hypothetical protein